MPGNSASALKPLNSLVVEVITDDVSDTYVSKTLFAVSEFSNVVLAGAKVISGEALLCANLGLGLRLVSQAENVRHTLLFDTGPEGAIFIRNCANLGIRLGEVESIAVSHGHWDHMAALPHAVEAIVKNGGQVAVHVNPGMFNERAVRLRSGIVVPVANVPRPAELEQRGAQVVNSPDARLLLEIAESEKRYVFHLVAGRFSLDEHGADGQAGNKLVLIGRNLDRAQLRSRLEACLAPAPAGLV